MTIGQGGTRELSSRGNSIFSGYDCETEVRLICSAVFKEGFMEQAVYDRKGRLVYAEAKIKILQKIIVFGSGRWLPLPIPWWTKKTIKYSAYC
jgi:hypothetical protein